MAAGSTGPEYVDLVFREIGRREAIVAAKQVSAAVDKMTDAEKASARAAGDAAARRVAAQRATVAAQEAASRAEQRYAALQRTSSALTMQRIEGMRAAYNAMRVVFQGAYQAAQVLGRNSADLAREYERLEVASTGFMRALSDGVSRGGGYTNFIRGLTDAFRELTPVARDAGDGISRFLGDVRDMVGYLTGGALGNAEAATFEGHRASYRRRRGEPTPIRGSGQYDVGWGEMGEYANLPQSTQENLDYEQGGILPSGQTVMPYGYDLGPQGVRAGRGGNRGGGGGGGGEEREYLTNEGLLEELANRAARAQADLFGVFLDDLSGAQDAVMEGIEAENEAQLENIRSQSEAWAALNQQRTDEAAFQMSLAEQAKQQALELTENMKSQAVQSANAIAGAFSNTAGIMGQLAQREQQQIDNITAALEASGASQQQIAEATKAHEERLDKLKKVEGGFIIAYSTVMAIVETAQAIASGAKYDFGAMAEHIAAAASFTAAAVMAGIKLGDDGSGGATASAPSTATFTPTPRDDEDTSEPSGAVVQIYTMGGSSARLGQELSRANRELQRSGIDSPMLGGGGWS